MQMVGAGASFISNVGASIGGATMEGLTALSVYLLWAVVTTLVFSLLFVVQVSRFNTHDNKKHKTCMQEKHIDPSSKKKTGKLLRVPGRRRRPVEQGLRPCLLQDLLYTPADPGHPVLQRGTHLQRLRMDGQAPHQQRRPRLSPQQPAQRAAVRHLRRQHDQEHCPGDPSLCHVHGCPV